MKFFIDIDVLPISLVDEVNDPNDIQNFSCIAENAERYESTYIVSYDISFLEILVGKASQMYVIYIIILQIHLLIHQHKYQQIHQQNNQQMHHLIHQLLYLLIHQLNYLLMHLLILLHKHLLILQLNYQLILLQIILQRIFMIHYKLC